MARALDQILSELNSVYTPQRDSYNAQIGSLDPQRDAEEQGLQAAQKDSFNQITQGANRRGLFFSGIPLEEQAKYTGSQFLPAVANLRSRYAQQKFNLQDAIGKVNADQYGQAYGIRQKELDTEEAQRQFDAKLAAEQANAAANRAASGGGGGLDFGGLSGGGYASEQTAPEAPAAPRYSMSQKSSGGFNFKSPDGSPISAAQYSQQTGIPFRNLVQQMAAAGDPGAKNALGLVGNDYGYNPTKINSQSQVALLRALGINASNYTAPKAATPTKPYPGNNVAGTKTLPILLKK